MSALFRLGSDGMSLIISSVFTYDEDAGNYIQAVEAADGQVLEPATRKAINNFVIGCKTDGIWNAIKSSCILAGARTLAGALVPLVGPAPTSFNFVSGDYNRKMGLAGNGSSKYLDSNRAANADPQNNSHLSVFKNDAITGTNPYYIGSVSASINLIGQNGIYSRSTTPLVISDALGPAQGLHGVSRSQASSAAYKRPGVQPTSVSLPSSTSAGASNFVFCYNNSGAPTAYSAARLAFYSIG